MKKFYSAILSVAIFLIIPQVAYADTYFGTAPIVGPHLAVSQKPCSLDTPAEQKDTGNDHCEGYPNGTMNDAWDVSCGGSSCNGSEDVATMNGTVIKANDTVTCENCDAGYGNEIKIQSTDGKVAALYGHLAYGSLTVKVGDKVTVGEKLGTPDNTGNSTGGHVHFSLYNYVNGSLIPLVTTDEKAYFNSLPYRPPGGIFSKIISFIASVFTPPTTIVFPPLTLPSASDLWQIAATALGLGNAGNILDWAISIGGVLAVAIIIYGGILYTASAGNPSRKENAKEWIKAAVLGLVLLLCAYLVLNTLNPAILGH